MRWGSAINRPRSARRRILNRRLRSQPVWLVWALTRRFCRMANRRCPISTVNWSAGAGRPHHATQRNGRNFSPCILKIDVQKAGKVYQLHPVVNPDSIQPQRNTVIERRPSLGVRADLCLCLLITLRWRLSPVTVRHRTFPNISPIDKMIGIPEDGLIYWG